MAYDAAHHAAVVLTIDLVSGPTATTTWTWSGTDWQQQHPVHQPSGASAIGAYDAKREVVVALIGDQTWTWNGCDWSQQHPANSPNPRFFSSAAHDPAVGKVMLFGGKIYGLAPRNSELVNTSFGAGTGRIGQKRLEIPSRLGVHRMVVGVAREHRFNFLYHLLAYA